MTEIEKISLIYRKYNLGDISDVKSKFPKINYNELNSAWIFASNKIQNKEIIKDGKDLNFEHLKKVEIKIKEFEGNDIFYYLNDNFDITKLALEEEKIERRFRNILANKYINSFEILRKERKKNIKSYLKFAFFGTLIIAGFNFRTIKEGITPVNILAEQIHEKSKNKFNGAICNDGWVSHSQGRGTCSHHDGVNYYFYKGEYSKTYEESLQEAKLKSWLDE